MKRGLSFLLILSSFGILFSCDQKDKDTDEIGVSSNIIYQEVDKQYVLNQYVGDDDVGNDDVSNYVDSILSGLINVEFISTGYQYFNLVQDESFDVAFEIINLAPFNPDGLPEKLTHLAARVIPQTIEILDNAGHGYPDAVLLGKPISQYGKWSNAVGVIGTFSDGGNFQGEGERFLGFRHPKGKDYLYGWIRMECSDYNDTLKIVDYAYNNMVGSAIDAGQVK